MKVVICDDEPLARDRLRRMLEKIETAEVVAEARNGIDLLDQLSLSEADLVITDIRMPGMTGLEAAQHIASLPQPPAVIFCTAYDEYAIQAFQVQAIGYLLKPVNQEDLQQALANAGFINKAQLQQLKQQLQKTPDQGLLPQVRQHISAKSRRGIELIPVNEVRYFMADQKYVSVHYPDGEVLIDESLKELEEEFGNRFLRVHRNALVALTHIETMHQQQNQCQLSFTGMPDRVTISRRHVVEVKKLLQQY